MRANRARSRNCDTAANGVVLRGNTGITKRKHSWLHQKHRLLERRLRDEMPMVLHACPMRQLKLTERFEADVAVK